MRIHKLYESKGLFERYLSQSTVFVEIVKQVSLYDLLSGQVTCEWPSAFAAARIELRYH